MKTEQPRPRPLLAAVAATALLATASCALVDDPPSPTPETTVTTGSGPIRGTAAEGYREYLGVPYAAPPIGEMRWRPPAPPEPWEDTLDATSPGPRCPQHAVLSGGDVEQSEDCLYLNITVPETANAASELPVMVWIHGGGFVEGSADEYDPHRLVLAEDVIVVTVNYRLGLFGNFGHPDLDDSGVFGLLDQQAALRWVRDRIGAFGGDAENVTVFGQSAGGQSICAHLASPTAEGLFHRAIIQSAFCTWDLPAEMLAPGLPTVSPWAPATEVAERGDRAAADLGCAGPDAVDCLRALPVEDLMPIFGDFAGPAFGTPTLPDNPYQVLRESRTHPVPVLSGSTRDENTLTQALHDLAGAPLTAEQYRRRLEHAFGDHADRVAERYPPESFASPSHAWAIATTDRAFSCPTLERGTLFARQAPAYTYEFADQNAPTILPEVGYPYGAYHSSDEAYLFDQRYPTGRAALDAEQQDLAEAMIAYWAAFARTGDPNVDSLPRWDGVDPDSRKPYVQELAPGVEGIGPTDAADTHQCRFWTTIDG
ncbi:MAG TPA: carboxylesterase family protein [Glycomyces sp.]|nr:carboxylesterase family protein [Glycomyces sp.]